MNTDQDKAPADEAEQPKESSEEALRKALQTPISREEAETAFADIDVQRLRLLVVRQKWQAEASQLTLRIQALDEQLTALDLEKAVIFRRTLNPTEEKPTDE